LDTDECYRSSGDSRRRLIDGLPNNNLEYDFCEVGGGNLEFVLILGEIRLRYWWKDAHGLLLKLKKGTCSKGSLAPEMFDVGTVLLVGFNLQ